MFRQLIPSGGARARLRRFVVALSVSLLLGLSVVALQRPPPTFGVGGTVLDVERRPVPMAEVRLVLENARGARLVDATRSDERGRFDTRGWIASAADSEGDWRLELEAAGYARSVVDQLFLGYGTYDVGSVFLFKPVKVTGRVTDDQGRAVVGAEIHAALGDASWSHATYAQEPPIAISGVDGRFECDALPPGEATLGVAARGHGDAIIRGLCLRADRPNVIDVRLTPEVPYSGSVVDVSGSPLARASVDVNPRAFWRAETATDDRGRFSVEGFTHDWQGNATVRALGFVPARIDGLPSAAQSMVLQPSNEVIVVAERDGDGPTPAIRSVRITDSTPPGLCSLAYTEVEVQSDPRVVEVLAPNRWRLCFDAAIEPARAGFQFPVASLAVRLDDGAHLGVRFASAPSRHEEVIVRAPAPGRIEGRVLRRDNREPVAGTTVMTNRWSVIEPHLVGTTDAEGRFSFDGITPDDLHDLTVDNELWYGRLSHFVVLAGETTRNLELLVAPPALIGGNITVAGQPPGEPVVIGLGEFQDYDVVGGGWFGLGISTASGAYFVHPKYDRRLTVVPKNRVGPEHGGYRRFRLEFPSTPRGSWPWQVQCAPRSLVRFDLDVPEWPAVNVPASSKR